MADAAVAMNALQGIFADSPATGNQFVDESLMAADAGVLEDRRVAWLNLNRFVKIHEGEPLGVPEAVFRLGEIFGNEIMRQVTIDAGGGLVMTSLLPRIILVAHYMAIRARPWILGEITQALAIIEGKEAQSGRQPDIQRGCDG